MVSISEIRRRTALIDVKASGLMSGSFPVEVGYRVHEVETDNSYREKIETYLIKPDASWTTKHWDPDAQAMHGLEFYDLKRHGHDPKSVVAHLEHYMIGRSVFTDTPEHDSIWLDRLHAAVNRPRTYRLISINRFQKSLGITLDQSQAIFAAVREKFGPTGRAERGILFLKDVVEKSIEMAGRQ